MEVTDSTTEFDSLEIADMLGMSAQQRQLAEGLRLGMSATAAAKRAGYSGTGATLRSSASKSARSPKVKRYLEIASASGAGISDEIGNLEELQRHLWRIVRGEDRAASLRASELLSRIETTVAARPKASRTPHEILVEIGEISAALAAELARKNNLPVPAEIREAADAQRAEIARNWIAENPDAAALLRAEGEKQTVASKANGTATPVLAATAAAHGNERDQP